MFGNLEILRMSQAFAAHAGLRQQAIAGNVANADTPGYRAREALPFADYINRLNTGGLPQSALFRPDPAPVTLSPDGNGVSLEHEMMRSASARSQHELALGIYGSARDLLRSALGR